MTNFIRKVLLQFLALSAAMFGVLSAAFFFHSSKGLGVVCIVEPLLPVVHYVSITPQLDLSLKIFITSAVLCF